MTFDSALETINTEQLSSYIGYIGMTLWVLSTTISVLISVLSAVWIIIIGNEISVKKIKMCTFFISN